MWSNTLQLLVSVKQYFESENYGVILPSSVIQTNTTFITIIIISPKKMSVTILLSNSSYYL